MFTHFVFNMAAMKTLGERIRQAREFRGLTGEELAKKVGYKTQSGISNLENRANGRGGFMLPRIAMALDVSVDWLLEGPDTHDMSTVQQYTSKVPTYSQSQKEPEQVREPEAKYNSLRAEAHRLIDEISDFGLTRVLGMLEDAAAMHPASSQTSAGVLVPAPRNGTTDNTA